MSEELKDLTLEEEDDAMLPDGWAEGDDFFDVDSWSGGNKQADASAEAEGEKPAEAEEDFDLEKFLTKGLDTDEGSAETTEEVPTTDETPEEKPRNKLKFSAQIDHQNQDVELDESELPTIYQKAHVTDRVQQKLAKMQPVYDKSERMAKMLGYDSVEAMLDAAEKSYTDSEVERLTSENVHPEVARDMVTRRIHDRETAPAPEKPAGESPAEQPPASGEPQGRNFRGEVTELLRAFPKLKGQQLPQEVVDDAVKNGTPLVTAYSNWKDKADEAEKTALRKEKNTLKQNADAAARAPVRGVSKGGATDTKAEDPFLKGFNADPW